MKIFFQRISGVYFIFLLSLFAAVDVVGTEKVRDEGTSTLMGTWATVVNPGQFDLRVEITKSKNRGVSCLLILAENSSIREECNIEKSGDGVAINGSSKVDNGGNVIENYIVLARLNGNMLRGKILPSRTELILYKMGSVEEKRAREELKRRNDSPFFKLEGSSYVSMESRQTQPQNFNGKECLTRGERERKIVFGHMIDATQITAEMSVETSVIADCSGRGKKDTAPGFKEIRKSSLIFILTGTEKGHLHETVTMDECSGPICPSKYNPNKRKDIEASFEIENKDSFIIHWDSGSVDGNPNIIYRRSE